MSFSTIRGVLWAVGGGGEGQLAERSLSTQKIRGSNPIITNKQFGIY